MKTPLETPEPAAEARVVGHDGPNVVFALGVYNGQHHYELPRTGSFTLGASRQCDIVLPGSGLSARHLEFEWRGERLRVRDLNSTNGTFLVGQRVRDIEYVRPGDILTPVPVPLLALNDVMLRHRPTMLDILGTRFAPTADEMLVSAAKGSEHLLILGDPGCDHERLAGAIHEVSDRRLDELVRITSVPDDPAAYRDILERARRSTLLIVVPAELPRSKRRRRRDPPLNATFCELAFSRAYRIRVTVVAASMKAAQRALPPELVDRMAKILLRPIAMRLPELPHLLDRLLAARGVQFRFDDLTQQNREALLAHEWRDNFYGLRVAADRVVAISRVTNWNRMTWRDRAKATQIPRSTLSDWFAALRLSDPLLS